HGDPVLPELERPDERHAHEPGLGGTVVRLPEVAAQAGRRRDVDDAPVPGVLHDEGRVVAAVERPFEVHADDGVEVLLVHLHEGAVAHDPGVVDEDVELTERVHGRPDDPAGAVEVRDGVVARSRLTAEGLDLLAPLRRRVFVGAAPVEADADVVDDEASTFPSHAQRELAANAPPRSRDHGDASVEQPHRDQPRFGTAAVAVPVSLASPSWLTTWHSTSTRPTPLSSPSRSPVTLAVHVSVSPGQTCFENRTW